jgi:outer membrane lipoprotein-sorting protein
MGAFIFRNFLQITPKLFRTQRDTIFKKISQIVRDGKMCFIYTVSRYSLALKLSFIFPLFLKSIFNFDKSKKTYKFDGN